MDRRVVEITINDTGNIEFSVFNNEIKGLNESQFSKVINTLTQNNAFSGMDGMVK